MTELNVPNLTIAGCRVRQQRLRTALEGRGLRAALISDRRHIYYFSGYWSKPMYTPLLLIDVDGPAILSAPDSTPPNHAAVDDALLYESARLSTQVDDQWTAAVRALQGRTPSSRRLGHDAAWASLTGTADCGHDIRPVMWSLRRAKDADELAIIRSAVAATEEAYRYASTMLQPGITEIELFAGMQAAAVSALGESIGEFGNAFQIGSLGGSPRRRRAVAGEIAVLDLSVVVRGYASDMCRSFVVGGNCSDSQMAAHQRIVEVLSLIEAQLLPGARCQELFELASQKLEGFHDCSFGHHLGHGIGLSAHEAPRLNPHWDDTLETGDVFAIEPGLYRSDLRAGLRLEQNYALTKDGLERLSSFPLSLN